MTNEAFIEKDDLDGLKLYYSHLLENSKIDALKAHLAKLRIHAIEEGAVKLLLTIDLLLEDNLMNIDGAMQYAVDKYRTILTCTETGLHVLFKTLANIGLPDGSTKIQETLLSDIVNVMPTSDFMWQQQQISKLMQDLRWNHVRTKDLAQSKIYDFLLTIIEANNIYAFDTLMRHPWVSNVILNLRKPLADLAIANNSADILEKILGKYYSIKQEKDFATWDHFVKEACESDSPQALEVLMSILPISYNTLTNILNQALKHEATDILYHFALKFIDSEDFDDDTMNLFDICIEGLDSINFVHPDDNTYPDRQNMLQIAIECSNWSVVQHMTSKYLVTEELQREALSYQDDEGNNALHYATYNRAFFPFFDLLSPLQGYEEAMLQLNTANIRPITCFLENCKNPEAKKDEDSTYGSETESVDNTNSRRESDTEEINLKHNSIVSSGSDNEREEGVLSFVESLPNAPVTPVILGEV